MAVEGTAPAAGGLFAGGGIFKKPVDMTGKWKCEVCTLISPIEKKRCIACGAPQPGYTEEQLKAESQKTLDSFLGRSSDGPAPGAGNAASVFGGAAAGGSTSSSSTFSFGVSAPPPAGSAKATSVFSFGTTAAAASTGDAVTSAKNSIFAINTSADGTGNSIFASNPALAAATGGAPGGATTSIFASTTAGGSSASTSNKIPSGGAGAAGGPVGFVFNAALSGATSAGGQTDEKNIKHNEKVKKSAAQWSRKRPVPSVNAGEVLVCGSGDCDQLGLGDGALEKRKPAIIAALSTKQITKIACGGMHTLALVRGGKQVYSWGCNDDGALGREKGHRENEPLLVEFHKGKIDAVDFVIDQVSAGDCHSVAKTKKGDVFCWGIYKDGNGHIGFPDLEKFGEILWKRADDDSRDVPAPCLYPREFTTLPEIKDIASGADHTVALAKSGLQVFTWGKNENGQLGQGQRTPDPPEPSGDDAKDKKNVDDYKRKKRNFLCPRQMVLPHDDAQVLKIGACADGTFVVSKTYRVYAVGLNSDGQLGCGPTKLIEQLREVRELRGKQISSISGGMYHAAAFDKTNQAVFCWGKKKHCGVNDPESTTGEYDTPIEVPRAAFAGCDLTNVVCTPYTVLATTAEGDLFGWGSGDMWQLANVPKDVDVGLAGREKPEVGDAESTPAIFHSKTLKERFVLAAAGGSQHTVILGWHPSIVENFKRDAALASTEIGEELLLKEQKEEEARREQEEAARTIGKGSKTSIHKLDSPGYNLSDEAAAASRDQIVSSPKRKRPKLMFSRSIVQECVREVKSMEKIVWEKDDPEIEMLDQGL